MRLVRVVLRISRVEVFTIVILAAGVSVAAIAGILLLDALEPPLECFASDSRRDDASLCVSIDRFNEADQALAGRVFAVLGVLPFAAGVLLGAPLIARETEHRTAQLVWPLAVSRWRWLIERLTILGGFLLLALALPSILASMLEAARVPYLDSAVSFADYGLRGHLLPARAVAAFAAALLVGIVARRVLPAIVISAALAFGLQFMLSAIWPFGHSLEPLAVAVDDPAAGLRRDVGLGTVYVDDAGTVYRFEDAIAMAPDPQSAEAEAWVEQNFRRVSLGIPGERLRAVELRETACLMAVTVVCIGAATMQLKRAAPY